MKRNYNRGDDGRFAPGKTGAVAPSPLTPPPPHTGGVAAPPPAGAATGTDMRSEMYTKFLGKVAPARSAPSVAERGSELGTALAGSRVERHTFDGDTCTFTSSNCSVSWDSRSGNYVLADRAGRELLRDRNAEEVAWAAGKVSQCGVEGWKLAHALEEVAGEDYRVESDGRCITVGETVSVEWTPGVQEYSVISQEKVSPATYWEPASYEEVEVLTTADPEEAARAAHICVNGGASGYWEDDDYDPLEDY